MNQSILTGSTGLYAQQRRLDTIANNVANINTYGFKSSRTDFKDALYATLLRPVQPQDDLNLQSGHGVLLAEQARQFTQGATFNTGMNTDFMIDGKGFFVTESAGSQRMYTRDGNFAVSVGDDGLLTLTTQGGDFVLDENGRHITLPRDANVSDLRMGMDGSMSIGSEQPFAKLGVVSFPDPNKLNAAGSNSFTAGEGAGDPAQVQGSKIIQGALEGSNVDLGLEMTRMIRAQRALSLASRAVTAADQMEGQANTIRG